MWRSSIDPDECDFNDDLIEDIIKCIERKNASIIIIDSLSYFTSEEQQKVMQKLKRLSRSLQLSIMVMGHTPKLPINEILTKSSLAYSRNLSKFCDSMFALNFSELGKEYRYGKQVKWRNGEYTTSTEYVITYKVKKVNGFLKFEQTDEEHSEYEHLEGLYTPKEKSKSSISDDTLAKVVTDIDVNKLTYNELSEKYNISRSTLCRKVKDYRQRIKAFSSFIAQ